MLFVNRDREIQAVEKDLSKPGLSITILYGRRRIGKTWILRKIMKKNPNSIYIFVPEAPPQILFKMFQEKLREKCGQIEARSWIGLLEELGTKTRGAEPCILLIDEFQRLGPGFISALQYYYDTNRDKHVKLILAGSSVSVVERLSGSLGPLYGRARLIPVKGFSFIESYIYLKNRTNADPLEAFKLYSVLGGSPYNLSLAHSRDWRIVAREEIHNIYGRLYEEPLHTLNSETREPGVYLGILEAASGRGAGYSKLAGVTGKTSLKRYIETLTSLGVLGKITPYGYNPSKTRYTWYYVSDPYWDYWLRTIYPRRMEAELTGEIPVDEEFSAEYFSVWFERVGRELLSIIHGSHVKPWWRKDIEIDAVLKGEKGVKVYEIKYRKLGRREIMRTLEALHAKSAKLGEPVESIGVVAIEAYKPKELQAEVYGFRELLKKALDKRRVSVEEL